MLLILFGPGVLFAQQWRAFTTADGLAHNNVTSILETMNGVMWFGTDDGISRYDGRWQTFKAVDGLAPGWVTTLIEASFDRAIWIGTGSGLSRYRDGDLQKFTAPQNEGLAGNDVVTLLESSDSAIWIATTDGLSRYENGAFQKFTTSEGLAGNDVVTLLESSDGAIWIGTSDGLSRYADGAFENFTTAKDLAGNDVVALLESSDRAIWIGTTDGLNRYENGVFQTFTTAEGLTDNFVQSLLESSDGAIWAATTDGASRYQNGFWKAFKSDNSELADPDVLEVLESSDGEIWFRTHAGVSRYRHGRFKTFTQDDGLQSDVVVFFLASSDGAMWFGTENGVSRYDGSFETFTEVDGLPSNDVRLLLEASDKTIWMTFGTESGVSRYENGQFQTLTEANGLGANWVTSLLVSSDGAMWFGTGQSGTIFFGNGVSRYEDGQFRTFTTDDGLANDDVISLLESSDGTIWVGTNDGVSLYQDGRFKTFTTDNGLADGIVVSMVEGSDHAIWMGTNGNLLGFGGESGISRYQDGRFKTFTANDGYAGNDVRVLFESLDGAIWIGTGWFGDTSYGKGMSRYLDGLFETFTTDDGLASNRVTSFVESNGSIWIGTDGGVNRYRDGRLETFTVNDGLGNNQVVSLLASSDQAIWVGTDGGGVSRYQDGSWQTFTESSGLASNRVRFLVESTDEAIWIATDAGVSRFKRPAIPLARAKIVASPPSVYGENNFFFELQRSEIASDRHPDVSYALIEGDRAPDDADWTRFANINGVQGVFPTNGQWTFFVRAMDRNGNVERMPAMRTFTVDVTPPTAFITRPRNHDRVAGTVAVEGGAFDTSPLKDFRSYILEYAQENMDDWAPIPPSHTTQISRDSVLIPVNPAQSPADSLALLGLWNTQDLSGDYRLRLTAVDLLGHERRVEVNVKVVSALEGIFGPEGGEVASQFSQATKGTAALRIPQNGIDRFEDVELVYRGHEALGKPDGSAGSADGLEIIYEVVIEQDQFKKPSTLIFGYKSLEMVGVDESRLGIFRLEQDSSWTFLGGTAQNGQISVAIDLPGVYGLFDAISDLSGSGVLALDCQPRAFAPSGGGNLLYAQATDILFQLGSSSDVNVWIYSLSGNLVREMLRNHGLNAGWNTVQWNGKDRNGRVVRSGLYIVVVEAGGKASNKTVAVVNR